MTLVEERKSSSRRPTPVEISTQMQAGVSNQLVSDSGLSSKYSSKLKKGMLSKMPTAAWQLLEGRLLLMPTILANSSGVQLAGIRMGASSVQLATDTTEDAGSCSADGIEGICPRRLKELEGSCTACIGARWLGDLDAATEELDKLQLDKPELGTPRMPMEEEGGCAEVPA